MRLGLSTLLLGFAMPACAPVLEQDAGRMDVAANCRVEGQDLHSRFGENWPLSFVLKNTGAWCGAAVGTEGGAFLSAEIVRQPSHGDARAIQQAGGTLIAYHPHAGYTGADSFQVALGAAGGNNITVNADVEVLPR
jgi:hypothetical protein